MKYLIIFLILLALIDIGLRLKIINSSSTIIPKEENKQSKDSKVNDHLDNKLPIDQTSADTLANKIIHLYNHDNGEKLFNLLGKTGKTEIPKNTFLKIFSQMKTVYQKIHLDNYSHYKIIKKPKAKNLYLIYYSIFIPDTDIPSFLQIIMNVTNEDQVELLGFKIISVP
ncbi:MAG: hypothetical protein COA79_26285 [Planctomycetota bacterium]|nr:MAG: hypothetical protein COA79_26285 [Planctomycetota bacterium]